MDSRELNLRTSLTAAIGAEEALHRVRVGLAEELGYDLHPVSWVVNQADNPALDDPVVRTDKGWKQVLTSVAVGDDDSIVTLMFSDGYRQIYDLRDQLDVQYTPPEPF